jgi:crotonobetainyl-CoA:carnitine CoA-transferase CaiB-like acyl-CoA transferase
VTDAHWKSLATIIGGDALANDERFTTLKGRVDLMDEVDKIVADWSATLYRAEIEELLLTARVPCSPVKELPEVVADPNLWHRGMLREMDHPELGPITAVSNPMRFGYGTPDDLSPSPRLGQHSREVLSELLGYSDEYLNELEVDGAI